MPLALEARTIGKVSGIFLFLKKCSYFSPFKLIKYMLLLKDYASVLSLRPLGCLNVGSLDTNSPFPVLQTF